MVANDPAHGHRLYVFLRRFSFPESVLDGAVEHCLGSSARRRHASSCRSRAWVRGPPWPRSLGQLVTLIRIFSLLCWRLPCLATRQVVACLVVAVDPQQSPESSIWLHIGTKSGGRISSFSSHASSIELNAFAVGRSIDVTSTNVYVAQLRDSLELAKRFAIPRLLAIVLLR